jgi:hypothetical protein
VVSLSGVPQGGHIDRFRTPPIRTKGGVVYRCHFPGLATSKSLPRRPVLADLPRGRHHRDRTSLRGEAGYLRDPFGRFHTRFRFALLFSRAFFVGLSIDFFRKFGQFFVSFCFFFERLLQ